MSEYTRIKCDLCGEDRKWDQWPAGEKPRKMDLSVHRISGDEIARAWGDHVCNACRDRIGSRINQAMAEREEVGRVRDTGEGVTESCGPASSELPGLTVPMWALMPKGTEGGSVAIQDGNPPSDECPGCGSPIKIARRGQGEGPIYYSCGAKTEWNIHTGRREGRCPAIKEASK